MNHNWAYIRYDTPYQAHLKIFMFAWVKNMDNVQNGRPQNVYLKSVWLK